MTDANQQIDSILSKEDYLSGKSFISAATTPQSLTTSQSRPTQFIPPSSTQTIPQYRTGLLKPKPNEPRHDPTAPDAIVLPRPPTSPDKKVIDVVLDPFLARHLRPHQKEGVRFLYECVMGLKDFNGRGAILADEMGLGKTLTVIALIWTLLSTLSIFPLLIVEQSPFPGESAVIKKVLVVCPVTLIVVLPKSNILTLELEKRIPQMAWQRTYWSLSSRPKIRSPHLYIRQNVPNNAPKLRKSA